jgi:hypothetical protein
MNGVDLRTVQELAGHKTIAMTVRYAHLAPEHNQAAIERLDPVEIKSEKRSQSGANWLRCISCALFDWLANVAAVTLEQSSLAPL